MSALDDVFVKDYQELIDSIGQEAKFFNLPLPVESRCRICGKDFRAIPQVRAASEFDEQGGAIFIPYGCGECGDNPKYRAKSEMEVIKVKELSASEYLDLYEDLRRTQKQVLQSLIEES